jgi:hypothetical protein
MRTIWKFPIAITDEFTIPDEQELTLPEMAQLLKVGLDPTGSPCAWFQVHTNAPKIKTKLFVVGTGNPMPDEVNFAHYRGSFNHGPFVWHVYMPDVRYR